MLQRKSYTSGHFELLLDGNKSTCYIKSVDGGHLKAAAVEEAIGTHNERIKSISTLDIEPFTIDFGISGAKDIMRWIQSSWKKQYTRRNGQITHANFNLNTTLLHEFRDALLTETTFPALDGASKETAYLKIKIQPEHISQTKVPNGAKVLPTGGVKQKLWQANAFRLTIDGCSGFEYANKIEAFTIKQGVKKMYYGEDRFPQLEPTKLEFPNISGTVAAEYAENLIAWHQKYLLRGGSELSQQKTGRLEYLAPDKNQILFSINLYEVGLHNLQVLHSQANQDAIKRVKFEMFVGRMEVDGSGALGMD